MNDEMEPSGALIFTGPVTFGDAAPAAFVGHAPREAMITIDVREVHVDVVYDDGHREALSLPPDAKALEVPLVEGKPLRAGPAIPRGMSPAFDLLHEVTRLCPPVGKCHHALTLDGDTLVLTVYTAAGWFGARFEPEDFDRPVGELAAEIVAMAKQSMGAAPPVPGGA